jgi:hypothetical protein
MQLALILAGLALTGLGVFAWLWLCAGIGSDGWRGAAGKAALQLSALGLAYGLVRGQLLSGIFYAAFPPLTALPLSLMRPFAAFLTPLALASAPYAAAILLLALMWRPTRAWAPGLAGLVLLLAAVVLGEGASQTAMCDAARIHGFTRFQRNAFDWSLFNTPQEWQFEIHALASKDGQNFGFSYRTLDWYLIPPETNAEVIGPAFTCPQAR